MSASEIAAGAAPISALASALEEMVRRARQKRDQILRIEPSLEQKLDDDWKIAVEALRQFQAKVEGRPQLQHFTVSRDESEISAKVKDASKRGFSYYILSRRHPTDRNAPRDRVWLSNLGLEEKPYPDALDAMAELMKQVVSRLV